MKRFELFYKILMSGAPTKKIAKELNDAFFAIDTYGFGEVTEDGWYQDWNNDTNSLDGFNQLPIPTDLLIENRRDFHYTSPFTKEVVENLIALKEHIDFFNGYNYESLNK